MFDLSLRVLRALMIQKRVTEITERVGIAQGRRPEGCKRFGLARRMAGPSTPPLAMRLQEASLRMTHFYGGEL